MIYPHELAGDGLPTMGEESEQALRSMWRCTCGEPDKPGVMHRQDASCYRIEPNHEDEND